MSPIQRYVSNELTHFVGWKLDDEESQYSLLVEILTSGQLSHFPHKRNVRANLHINTHARLSDNEMYTPEVVCFCDIPTGELDIHISKYSCFGLSFLKSFLVRKGANPVFYIAKNSMVEVPADLSDSDRLKKAAECSHTIGLAAFVDIVPRSEHFDKMIQEYHDLWMPINGSTLPQEGTARDPSNSRRLFNLQLFLAFQVFSFFQFFDDTKPDEDPKNFYMEREWRILGNLEFELGDVWRVILPKSYATRLRKDVPDYTGQITFVGKERERTSSEGHRFETTI